MKYLLSTLAICAFINASHAYEYQLPSEVEMQKKMKAAEAMAKQYESFGNMDIGENGEITPEAMEKLMDMAGAMTEAMGDQVPGMADFKDMMNGVKEYNNCIDQAEGAGTSSRIMSRMLKRDVLEFTQKMAANAQKYCDIGRRDEAKDYVERNGDTLMKRLFPKEFSTMKRCEDTSSYKEMQEHPCDV